MPPDLVKPCTSCEQQLLQDSGQKQSWTTSIAALQESSQFCSICRFTLEAVIFESVELMKNEFPNMDGSKVNTLSLEMSIDTTTTLKSGLVSQTMSALLDVPETGFVYIPCASEPGWEYPNVPRKKRVHKIVHWLQDCQLNHLECRAAPTQLPRRLIKINPTSQPRYKLVYTDTLNPYEVKYGTLSYCWGATNTALTTSTTEPLYLNEIPESILPLTIQDALEIAEQSGLPYFWIDAFCIIQGDRSDWETEASRMADIYSGSTLALAASEAKDSSGGLFAPPSTDPHRRVFRLNRPSPNPDVLLQMATDGHDTARIVPPLHARGWTLQESVLSRRMVQFPQNELQWRCRTLWATEYGSSYDQRLSVYGTPPFLSPSRPLDWHATWWKWVESYSRRNLTVPTDRVPAIVGSIQQYEAVTGDTSVLGLWQGSLAEDLLWTRITDADDGFKAAVRELGLPSWSWLSVPAQVHFDFFGYYRTDWRNEDHARVDVKRLSWTGKPYFSRLEHGMLRVSAPAKMFRLDKAATEREMNPPYWIVDQQVPDVSVRKFDYTCAAQFDHETPDGGKWLCMLLRTRVSKSDERSESFLILEDAGDPDTFRRIGTGVFFGEASRFDLKHRIDITLV